jgi:hypothetical protein
MEPGIRPDVDDRLSDVGARDSDHGLARRHHLSLLSAHRSDNAGEIGLHLCIAKLLDRLCQVGLGVSDRCFGASPDLCIVQRLSAGCVGEDQHSLSLLRCARGLELSLHFRELCSG